MTTEEAKKNLQSLLDTCIVKGNIINNAETVIALQQSIDMLTAAESQELKIAE